jgi:RNA polymerase sigma factor (sigma-70 family)
MSNAVIINAIKNGDKKELAEVYKAHRSEFVGWATSRYQCSKEEARDIYQSTIIIFYDNIMRERLQELNGSVKTYLFAIGKNKILELRRGDQKFNLNVDPHSMVIEDGFDDDKIKREAELSIVQKCLEKLGEPCRTMLELYYYHETGLEKLAEMLHYKNGDTVKNLKSRCLTRLRELVMDNMKKQVN